jgi:hypothetical protein
MACPHRGAVIPDRHSPIDFSFSSMYLPPISYQTASSLAAADGRYVLANPSLKRECSHSSKKCTSSCPRDQSPVRTVGWKNLRIAKTNCRNSSSFFLTAFFSHTSKSARNCARVAANSLRLCLIAATASDRLRFLEFLIAACAS